MSDHFRRESERVLGHRNREELRLWIGQTCLGRLNRLKSLAGSGGRWEETDAQSSTK